MMPPMTAARSLDLTTLASQCRLSAGVRIGYVEAASVMLAHYRQSNPCDGHWRHNEASDEPILVIWNEPDEPMMRTHHNAKDATEHGAYAVAIAAVHALGFEVCGRTVQGSGADFWMVKRGGDPADVYHLEVSGIGEAGAPGYRLAKKTDQGQSGSLRRPGTAVVFRFKDASLGTRSWE